MRKERVIKTCPQCGKRFLALRDIDIYCGRRCYIEYLREGGWKNRGKAGAGDRSRQWDECVVHR